MKLILHLLESETNEILSCAQKKILELIPKNHCSEKTYGFLVYFSLKIETEVTEEVN